MSDLTTLTGSLAAMRTSMINRLIAQGDTTIQTTDTMQTIVEHFSHLAAKSATTLNITENGSYTASTSDISGYGSITVNVPAGGPATKTKYKIGDRVYDSTDTAIGTVFCFYTDANNVEYAVVCLDATYRLASGQWASATGSVTNMPLYGSVNTAAFGIGTETATANSTLILASKTSNAVTHCRSKSFLIDGTRYYGQLPNICETIAMFAMHSFIEANDPTASSAGDSLNFTTWKNTWSSSQGGSSSGWYVNTSCTTNFSTKNNNCFVAPVLEIPNH